MAQCRTASFNINKFAAIYRSYVFSQSLVYFFTFITGDYGAYGNFQDFNYNMTSERFQIHKALQHESSDDNIDIQETWDVMGLIKYFC